MDQIATDGCYAAPVSYFYTADSQIVSRTEKTFQKILYIILQIYATKIF